MIKLRRTEFGVALALYRTTGAFFPLIGAVLLGKQDGVVYADDSVAPVQVYVEHAFGFAQTFGTPEPEFEAALKEYLVVGKRFHAAKVRLYTPLFPDFLASPEWESLRSQRQRFFLSTESELAARCSNGQIPADVRIVNARTDNVDEIERRFGVVGRFWRSPRDFVAEARAVVAFMRDVPAAICYAAAVADGKAEIDVLSLPEYRRIGLGKIVVSEFCRRCLECGITPLWDCFTNNVGSMALCRAAGFVPAQPPYPFFTFNK